jgi:regulation of enolase protein 1 (concanavalin A-like superfamily)
MRLIVTLLLGGVVSVAMAAPAPFHRPAKESGPWFIGWDRPVDPVGGCCFARRGDKMTIHVPGEGHELDYSNGRFDAPHLRRVVRGDFALSVRLNAAHLFRVKGAGRRQAGLVVMSGDRAAGVFVEGSSSDCWVSNRCFQLGVFGGAGQGLSERKSSLWLRVQRKGETLESAYSFNGKSWCEKVEDVPSLGPTTTVAVFAASGAEGAFKVEFDELEFTLRGDKINERREARDRTDPPR